MGMYEVYANMFIYESSLSDSLGIFRTCTPTIEAFIYLISCQETRYVPTLVSPTSSLVSFCLVPSLWFTQQPSYRPYPKCSLSHEGETAYIMLCPITQLLHFKLEWQN